MGNQRSNKGGAKRGQDRAAEVRAQNEERRLNQSTISDVNFASQIPDAEAEVPSGDAPDPNSYEGHEDDGFVKNVVAGGSHPDDGGFTPGFVNGVDHEEVDEDVPETDSLGNPVYEDEVSEPVKNAPEAPVEDGKKSG